VPLYKPRSRPAPSCPTGAQAPTPADLTLAFRRPSPSCLCGHAPQKPRHPWSDPLGALTTLFAGTTFTALASDHYIHRFYVKTALRCGRRTLGPAGRGQENLPATPAPDESLSGCHTCGTASPGGQGAAPRQPHAKAARRGGGGAGGGGGGGPRAPPPPSGPPARPAPPPPPPPGARPADRGPAGLMRRRATRARAARVPGRPRRRRRRRPR